MAEQVINKIFSCFTLILEKLRISFDVRYIFILCILGFFDENEIEKKEV